MIFTDFVDAPIAGQIHPIYGNYHFAPVAESTPFSETLASLVPKEALASLEKLDDAIEKQDLECLLKLVENDASGCVSNKVAFCCIRAGWVGGLEILQGIPKNTLMEILTTRDSQGDHLTDLGAGLDDTDSIGWSVVHNVCTAGSLDALEYLLTLSKVDLNRVNDHGVTPLMNAAIRGHKSIVLYLISKGADPWLVDKDGQTAFDVAVLNGHFTIGDILMDQENPNGVRPVVSLSFVMEHERASSTYFPALLLASTADNFVFSKENLGSVDPPGFSDNQGRLISMESVPPPFDSYWITDWTLESLDWEYSNSFHGTWYPSLESAQTSIENETKSKSVVEKILIGFSAEAWVRQRKWIRLSKRKDHGMSLPKEDLEKEEVTADRVTQEMDTLKNELDTLFEQSRRESSINNST